MTSEEAKYLLDNLIGMVSDNQESDYDTALKMAIKALEQEPCEDCIARQPLIDNWNHCADMLMGEGDAEVVMEWIFDAPSVNPQKAGHWIPVSERLPTKEEYIANNGLFIVSDGNRNYAEYFDIYDSKKFGELIVFGFRVDKCVIAWMPLPVEPYKAESEE